MSETGVAVAITVATSTQNKARKYSLMQTKIGSDGDREYSETADIFSLRVELQDKKNLKKYIYMPIFNLWLITSSVRGYAKTL